MAESAKRFDALQKRTLELEEKGNAKQASIERLQAALKEHAQARAIVEERSSSALRAESGARREAARGASFGRTQTCGQALDTQLTVQRSRNWKRCSSALQEATQERERVLQTLAEDRSQTSAALKAEKAQTAAQEKEFRERLAAAHAESGPALGGLAVPADRT